LTVVNGDDKRNALSHAIVFFARIHSRGRVSSKMTSIARGRIIAAMPPRMPPPLHQRAYVGKRTMEFECNCEILGGDGRQFRNSTDFPTIPSKYLIELRSVIF
jgi:hypothetical protein